MRFLDDLRQDPQIEFLVHLVPTEMPTTGVVRVPMIARLADGVSLETATAEANVIIRSHHLRGGCAGLCRYRNARLLPAGPARTAAYTLAELHLDLTSTPARGGRP